MAVARPASTVVLLRPSATRFDVFLVKRHESTAFMGGAHVFPGGRVDPRDRLEHPREVSDGVDAAIARMPNLEPIDTVAYFVAAVRELFEEAGVLLARDAAGAPVALGDERWGAYRAALSAPTMALADVAARERIRLALDTLVPFAHWITPEEETKRFDVRFFMAALPSGQEPSHDRGEMSEGVWLDPSAAIEQGRADAIALPPPTWTTLRMLERLTSVERALAWAREQPLVAVRPRITDEEGVRRLTLPGDPAHPAIPGFETPAETRFVLDDRRWRPVKPGREER